MAFRVRRASQRRPNPRRARPSLFRGGLHDRPHGFGGRVRRGPLRRERAGGESRIRPEIQALRAVAVSLVAVYHFWPEALHGGYVGVDVFFAISGFLITTQLMKEVDRTGRVSMPGFWARRARRILPAALAVLLMTAALTVAFVPFSRWSQFFSEMEASTAYAQNWHLAATAVDYGASENAPSSLQHYWSLSAEEQFYLVWPVVILLAAAATRIRAIRIRRRPFAIVLSAITLASLAYGIYGTQADAAAAYFVTPTRAWEFGFGGLLALVQPLESAPQLLRSLLSWIGLAAIAYSALAFSDSTPFPGVAALIPVMGAIMFMSAGAPEHRSAPTPVLKLRPVQFVGDVSYSVYLWHWPLLIIAPFAIGALTTDTRIMVLALAVFAAWITKLTIEDPIRRGPFLTRRRPRWTLVLTAVATAAVMIVALQGAAYTHAQIVHEEEQTNALIASQPDCFGAAARDLDKPCANPDLALTVVPTPAEAAAWPNAPCTVTAIEPLTVCEFGVSRREATATIALAGDSHASHLRAALAVVAKRHRWHGVSLTHSGCPVSRAVKKLRGPLIQPCIDWNRSLPRWLAAHPSIRTLFVAQESGQKWVIPRGERPFQAEVDGFVKAWRALPRTIENIIVIRDTPKNRDDTNECVERAMAERRPAGDVCAVPRRVALDRDAQAVAAQRLRSKRVRVVDLTRYFCDSRTCWPVIGGVLVHKDNHHLTAVYATTLGPYLDRALADLPR